MILYYNSLKQEKIVRRLNDMRRFIGILCALCLAVGVFSGICFAPSEQVKAEVPLAEECPGTVAVVNFSDSSFPGWDSLAEVHVSSGAAVTLGTATGPAFSVGGQSQWTHGIIVAKPETGWSVKSVSYGFNNQSENNTVLTTGTLSDAISAMNSNSENNVPSSVSAALSAFDSTDPNTVAIYVARNLYQNMQYRNVYVDFQKDTEIKRVFFNVKTDEIWLYDEDNRVPVSIGDEIDVFSLEKVTEQGLLSNYAKAEYSIDKYGNDQYSDADNIEPLFTASSDENYGKFRAKKSGIYEFNIKNVKSGLVYIIPISVTHASMPLGVSDFNVSSTAQTSFGENSVGSGSYYVSPAQDQLMKDLTISFTLPSGVTLKSVKYSNNELDETEKLITISNEGVTGCSLIASRKSEGSLITVSLKTINTNEVLQGGVVVVVSYNSIDYEYVFNLWYNRAFGISGYGSQLQPVAIGSVLEMSTFLYFSDQNDVPKFYEGINRGIYETFMQGMVPQYENGVFTGKVIVYYPCDHMVVVDKTTSTIIYSGDANIQVRGTALIEAGTTLDMTSILKGYWNENSQVGMMTPYITPASGNNYSAGLTDGGKTFVAPASVSETVEFDVDYYLARIKVKVCPAGTLMTSLSEAAKDVARDENLIVDAENNTSISKDTLNNFKQYGGDNSSIVVKNSKNVHAPEWHFNWNDLKNAAMNDINMSVAVGDEVKSSRLDKVGGLKVGFAANGTLPGKTVVRFYLSDEEIKKFTDPFHISMFYDDGNRSIKREGKNLYVATDIFGKNYIDIYVTHNSDFVLTSVDAETLSVIEDNPSSDVGGSTGGGSSYSGGSGTGSGSTSGTAGSVTDSETVAKEEAKEDKKDAEKTEKDDKNATVTENEDGSVTKSTVTENKDGSKTTVDETKFADGSKAVTETTENADGTESTKTTVTDENGEFYSETVTEESVTKKGTKIEESSTTYADGSTAYTEIRTTKSGKVEETTVKLDKNGKGTASVETTKADGTTESRKFTISTDGVVRIKAVETDGTKATVPESVNVEGKEIPVTIIGKNAFAGTDVEKVTVGSNITTIGVGAFNDAASLKSIVFKAANVTKIYKGAFDGIAEDAVIKITASSKKEYNRLVKLIKKSGIAKTVKFKRVK